VTVGDNGTILTSPDGTTWAKRNSGTSNDLYGLTYGNGLFVAVGDNGTIVRSTDNGSSFDNVTSPTLKYLYGVGF